jgi:peptidoglycan/xylan/chitin deacetylase (PgdA/CDA1 family)
LEITVLDLPYHAYRLVSRIADRRPVRLSGAGRGVVSFTFDDFPASAERGAEILERAGARGTFYLCVGRLGEEGPQGQIAGEPLVRGLRDRGHEIGCHTLSHLRAADTKPAAFQDDLIANNSALSDRFGIAARSFAFPYGSVTPTAKAAAGALYSTSRTTRAGINRGTFDANLLRGNSIYGSSFSEAVRSLVGDCASRGGWLIFYTHDVATMHSQYGCAPEVLVELVALAKARGCDILPVAEVALKSQFSL